MGRVYKSLLNTHLFDLFHVFLYLNTIVKLFLSMIIISYAIKYFVKQITVVDEYRTLTKKEN